MIIFVIVIYAIIGIILGHRDAVLFNEILNRKYPTVAGPMKKDSLYFSYVLLFAFSWPLGLLISRYINRTQYKDYL